MTKEKFIQIGLCNDNEWLDNYLDLINSNITTKRCSGKTQEHHIIPKYYFKNNNLDLDESDSNLVNLLVKDHIKAHYYLLKCSKTQWFKACNLLAIRHLISDDTLNESDLDFIDFEFIQEQYEKSREDIYEKIHQLDACKKIQEKLIGKESSLKGKTWGKHEKRSRKNPNAKNKKLSDYASQRTGEKNSFYGKTHSEEVRKLLSEKRSYPVVMIDYNTKEIIKEFNSIKEAANYLVDLGIVNTMSSASSRISAVCKLGDLKHHAYGYCWNYKSKV